MPTLLQTSVKLMLLQEAAFAPSFVLIPEIDDLSIIMGLSTDTDVPRMITLNWVIVSQGYTSRYFLEAEIVRTDKQLLAWVTEIGMSELLLCTVRAFHHLLLLKIGKGQKN
ncbi:hypothetical protein HYE68_004638 [Fusarium pseudograminearum]|nr:hypothetical protein HYE68_004638 [Fusarium pseudograminearum]